MPCDTDENGLIKVIHLAEGARRRLTTSYCSEVSTVFRCLVHVPKLLLGLADCTHVFPPLVIVGLTHREKLQGKSQYSSLGTQCSQKV